MAHSSGVTRGEYIKGEIYKYVSQCREIKRDRIGPKAGSGGVLLALPGGAKAGSNYQTLGQHGCVERLPV